MWNDHAVVSKYEKSLRAIEWIKLGVKSQITVYILH